MGDRIVIMLDGSVQQVGAPMDIYQKPAIGSCRALSGARDRLPDSAFGVRVVSWKREDKACGFLFRPTKLRGWNARRVKKSFLASGQKENLLLRPPAAPGCEPLLVRIDIIEAIGSDIYLNFSR